MVAVMADLSTAAARRAEAQKKWRKALRDEHRRLVNDLRARRQELGMSQQDVADHVAVSRSQIANAESGKHLLSVEALIGYAVAVGARITLEDGVPGDPHPIGEDPPE